MTDLFANSAVTTLAGNGGGISFSAASLKVASSVLFPAPLSSQQFRIVIDSEILLVSSVSGLTWAVSRGAEGTSPANHSDGALVYQFTTAASLSSFRQYTKVLASGGDDTTAILAAIATGGDVFLPSPSYTVGTGITAGTVFPCSAASLHITGNGATTITYAPNITMTADITLFQFTGLTQGIEGLSVVGGLNMTDGAAGYQFTAVNPYAGSFRCRVRDLDISNVFGGNTAGGAGIALYQPFNSTEVSTTLGTTVASTGSHTVTPPSMAGIYTGRTLQIGGTAETVVVTAKTATTFTATYAHTHGSTDSVIGWSNGNSSHTIERCRIHDSYQATGIICNSAGNTFRDIQVSNVGSDGTEHGIYVQTGDNQFEKCRVQGASGYSFHAFYAVQGQDASGNVFTDCTSIDPGTGHFVLEDSFTSDGTNPELPTGLLLARQSTVKHCTLKTRKNHPLPTYGINMESNSMPALIDGCYFEDAATIYINAPPAGTQIVNPRFVGINHTTPTLITSSAQITVKGAIATGMAGAIMSVGGDSITQGNLLPGVHADSSGEMSGNYLTTSPNYVALSLSSTWIDLHDNTFLITHVNDDQLCTIAGGEVGVVRNNHFIYGATYGGGFKIAGATPNLDFDTNDMAIGFSGAHASTNGPFSDTMQWPVDRAMGKLLYGTKAAEAVADRGYLFKKVAGAFTLCTTSDTQFEGIGLTDSASGAGSYWYTCGRPGTEANVQTDGTWTAGHIGIVSSTVAGKAHDNGGTTPPAAPASYVVFLDAGVGAGLARCRVIKGL